MSLNLFFKKKKILIKNVFKKNNFKKIATFKKYYKSTGINKKIDYDDMIVFQKYPI